MRLNQAGEWKLIDHLRRRFSSPHSSLSIGQGDDAALFRPSSNKQVLITTDLFTEGIDFKIKWSSFQQIGHTAMAANLSDIAAMGGTPRYALVALALPKNTRLQSVDELYRGLMKLGRQHGVHLIGGDTSSSLSGISLTVILVGEVDPKLALTRSKAQPGDQIYVTGFIGNSRAGLEILRSRKRRLSDDKHQKRLVEEHLAPQPRVNEGQLLAAKRIPSSMIDLSDGLATDIRHLCRSSDVGAQILLDKIPISPWLTSYSLQKKRAPYHYALEGGEDFELLFTVPSSRVGRLKKLEASGELISYPIGKITTKSHGITVSHPHHGEKRLSVKGYEHFI